MKVSKKKRVTGSMKKRGRPPKLGSGTRFRNLVQNLTAKGKSVEEAKRIAASIGRRKYGKAKFAALSRKGR